MPGPPGGVWEGNEQHIWLSLMFAAPLSQTRYLAWNSRFHTVFNLTIRSAKYWLPECSDTGRKKNAKIAMPWPANATNVWRWEIHWLYDTVSVFPMKMCIIMYPFEGPNGHLRQGQQWNEVSSGHDRGNDHGVLGTSLRKEASDHDKAWLKIANMWDLPLSATATDESVQCSRLSPNCLLKMATGHFVCWLLGCLHHVYLHIRTSSPGNFRALWSWETPQTQQAPLYTRCAEETFILCGSLRKWHPVRTRIKCLRGHLV